MGTALGYQWVKADLRKHKRNTRKVVEATLKVRSSGDTFTDVTWKNAYIAPEDETTGFGSGGHPDITARITLWRIKETSKPRPDDKIVIGDDTYLIGRVNSRLNGDESKHFAVYDCDCVRN